ncbi:hypothetical protein [Albidovulum sp.]|uniref:hypothetical protein n=1 Tax=Albidovulum sp. TaxID=1872424 RepID=UPI0039B8543B
MTSRTETKGRTGRPFTAADLAALAGRGLGRVDRDGERGATLCSTEEIVAMAMVCALAGVTPIYPGTYAPPTLIPHTEGERA